MYVTLCSKVLQQFSHFPDYSLNAAAFGIKRKDAESEVDPGNFRFRARCLLLIVECSSFAIDVFWRFMEIHF
jgi:hypothetical protein